jgi:hypothetical protein
MKCSPGPWGFEDETNKHMVTAGRDRKGAFIYVCDPSYSPARMEKGNSLLIAAAPTMQKEILKTMDRLHAIIKKRKYAKDNELMTALMTIHSDLNYAAAQADGSWPTSE